MNIPQSGLISGLYHNKPTKIQSTTTKLQPPRLLQFIPPTHLTDPIVNCLSTLCNTFCQSSSQRRKETNGHHQPNFVLLCPPFPSVLLVYHNIIWPSVISQSHHPPVSSEYPSTSLGRAHLETSGHNKTTQIENFWLSLFAPRHKQPVPSKLYTSSFPDLPPQEVQPSKQQTKTNTKEKNNTTLYCLYCYYCFLFQS